MKVLVLNSGSSSLKYQLFEMPEGKVLCAGLVEKIGESTGKLELQIDDNRIEINEPFADHKVALHKVAQLLTDPQYQILNSASEIEAVGHRVVHGGERFSATTLITPEVKTNIQDLFSLAPLHNPANLQGIEVAEKVFAEAKQYAVFDTAFHSSIPEHAYRFAIPKELYSKYGTRVYGFHGTSHRYVANQAIKHLGLINQDSKIITVHLGNGCSIAAVKNGQSIDTSMGLGPLSGLIMGTRSGDIDPSVLFYLLEQGYEIEQIKTILNKQSGMKGLTGDNDLRNINTRALEGDLDAQLALDMYSYRIKKYIGAYMAALGGVDAIVFTAGVGENDAATRAKSCAGMHGFGIEIDSVANETRKKGIREIQHGKVKILVIPTDEEYEIARQSYNLILGKSPY
ncbi:acetate kinase [Reichenbachiella sp. 5M10]|uniref:acetate/propionate family kinase n=1 Tax=Reichenbachiella sp. 5M10 TaxID=1889772 RepID=UPI000C162351|nr:acetate kinase [Reichenbachiella sp. 5M10]PIB34596.1 acetate kinase [Reichenbachiella sp. 5M10]